jgi:hypothetical protein
MLRVTVYADALFMLNAFLDGSMLLAGARLGGGQIRLPRILAAAALGGLYAAASIFPGMGFLRSPVMKAAALVLIGAAGLRGE